jgi:hypothetical protein
MRLSSILVGGCAATLLLAATPATAHPASITSAKLLATLQDPTGIAATEFGDSVSISGTTAVVGANDVAYIYTNSAKGWSTKPTVVLHDPGRGDFGRVAISGSIIMIGAPGASTATGYGAVYVYNKGTSGWPTIASATIICPTNCQQGFGSKVKLSGSTAVIGDGGGNSGDGSAYIYSESGGVWGLTTTLLDPRATFNDGFGDSVAFGGTTIVVGASFSPYNTGIGPGGGTVYIYSQKGGVWPTSPTVTLNDPVGPVVGSAVTDNFGYSVALAGNTVAVGAVGGNGTNIQNGAVMLYTANRAGVWPTYPTTILGGPYAYSAFGYSVAMNATKVFVGVPSLNGAVEEFVATNGVWPIYPAVTVVGPLTYGELGVSVQHSGSTLIAGAPGGNGGTGAVGHAYIYSL